MTKFIAIPVSVGDAFYLKRGDWSVLVDGGKNEQAFPSLFTTHANHEGVNILVCTHNDADHANGVLGFLKAGLSCRELWLPGRWLDALPGVLEPFEILVEDLAHQIRNVDREREGRETDNSSLEAYAATIDGNPDEARGYKKELELGDDGWPQEYLIKLEQTSEMGWRSKRIHYIFIYNLVRHHFGFNHSQLNLLWSAIDAAERIQEIATEAFNRGIKVRWFEFDSNNPKGGIPELRPINCREIARVHATGGLDLLMYLALSTVNKESLVFRSPGAGGQGDVLFTADSDLAGINNLGSLENALVTSPHHGSSANLNAYMKVQADAINAANLTWVRSDGRFSKRPGSDYLGVAGKRFCTICRLNPTAFSHKQAVIFQSSHSGWNSVNPTYSCRCI